MMTLENTVPENLFYSLPNLHHVNDNIRRWSDRAQEAGANIQPTLQKIEEIKENMPSLNVYPGERRKNEFRNGIILIYQNKMRRYYLCELIRECTFFAINKLLQDANTKFIPNSTKLIQAKTTHHWLMKQLPAPVPILRKPDEYEDLYLNMENECDNILDEIDRAREKLKLN